MGIDTPTWSETTKNWGKWKSNEELATTLNGAVTWNGEYMKWASRQEYIDILFEKALKARESGDMDAFRDYMDQIDNLNDEGVLWY